MFLPFLQSSRVHALPSPFWNTLVRRNMERATLLQAVRGINVLQSGKKRRDFQRMSVSRNTIETRIALDEVVFRARRQRTEGTTVKVSV